MTPPHLHVAPTRLLHVTRTANSASILEHGLIGTPFVFFGETVDDCLVLMRMRLMMFLDWNNPVERELDQATSQALLAAGDLPAGAQVRGDGIVTVLMPRQETNTHVTVLEIDTLQLDPSRLAPSDDHAACIFGDVSSWMYLGNVPASAIISHTTHPL